MYFIILHYSRILYMFNLCGYASKWLDLQDEPAKTKVPGSIFTQILGYTKAYIYVYLHMLTSSSIHCIDMAIAIAEISQYQVEKGRLILVIFRIWDEHVPKMWRQHQTIFVQFVKDSPDQFLPKNAFTWRGWIVCNWYVSKLVEILRNRSCL